MGGHDWAEYSSRSRELPDRARYPWASIGKGSADGISDTSGRSGFGFASLASSTMQPMCSAPPPSAGDIDDLLDACILVANQHLVQIAVELRRHRERPAPTLGEPALGRGTSSSLTGSVQIVIGENDGRAEMGWED